MHADMSYMYAHLCYNNVLSFANLQEHVLTGGHGLMVNGYDPVIKALSRDLDVHLNHRYAHPHGKTIHMDTVITSVEAVQSQIGGFLYILFGDQGYQNHPAV